jgi:hypothetical protein
MPLAVAQLATGSQVEAKPLSPSPPVVTQHTFVVVLHMPLPQMMELPLLLLLDAPPLEPVPPLDAPLLELVPPLDAPLLEVLSLPSLPPSPAGLAGLAGPLHPTAAVSRAIITPHRPFITRKPRPELIWVSLRRK